MTIKEAILQSLSDIKQLTNSIEVCKHIIENNYYDFGDAKTNFGWRKFAICAPLHSFYCLLTTPSPAPVFPVQTSVMNRL